MTEPAPTTTAGAGPTRTRLRRVALVLSVLVLVAGVALAIADQPDLLQRADPLWMLVILLVGIPLAVLLNAVEFRYLAHLVGREMPLRRAGEVVVVARAANLLPLPGGTLVRVAGLRAAGARLGSGVSATLLSGVLMIGLSLIVAGVAGLAFHPPVGWLLAAGGLVLVVACQVLAVRIGRTRRVEGLDQGAWWRLPALLTATRLGLVLVDAARLWICLLALDTAATLAQAAVLGVSSVAGSAVALVPAGLGVREVAAAMIGEAIAIPWSAALLAVSLNRLLGLAVMAPLGVALASRIGASAPANR